MTDFPAKLKKAGLKVTVPRLKILETLEAHADSHLSAEDVYKLMLKENAEVGVATIYRVLTQCEQAGLVKRLQSEEGPALFELKPADHHDHFICTRCGNVDEFHDKVIEERQQKIAAQAGFVMENHSMILYGICRNCRAKSSRGA